MRTRSAVIAVVFVALMFASCSDDAPEAPADPIFMVFVEQTQDVAAWNARYESNTEMRLKHGMSEVLSAEDLDSTGTVVVIQEVEDPALVGDYLSSESAVLGTSPAQEATSFRMVALGQMPERPVALLVIRNRVEDFEAWRAGHERSAEIRSGAGIHVAGIGRALGDEANLLQAYFATDLDAARRWAEGEPARSVRFLDPIN